MIFDKLIVLRIGKKNKKNGVDCLYWGFGWMGVGCINM